MAKKQILGLPFIAVLILQIFFPPLGGIIRILKDKILLGIIAIILFPIFWVIDVVSLIRYKDYKLVM